MTLMFLACWQPSFVETPEPPVVLAADVLAGRTEEAQAEGVEAAEAAEPGEAAAPAEEGVAAAEEEAAAVPGEAPGEAAPSAPAELEVSPYSVRTTVAPVTLVNDSGETLAVLTPAGVSLTVLREGEVRLGVRCSSCSPAVDGWVQKSMVAR